VGEKEDVQRAERKEAEVGGTAYPGRKAGLGAKRHTPWMHIEDAAFEA